MTDRLELSWKLDGFVDEQRYYCSETPINVNSLPTPKAILAGDVRAYVDTNIEIGKMYRVCIGSVKNGVEKMSDIKIVRAGGDEHWASVVSLLRFENGIIDETGRIWSAIGSPTTSAIGGEFGGQLTLNGSSGLLTNASGFDFGTSDFTIEAFVKQTTPNNLWREFFMSNIRNGINIMLYSQSLAAGRELTANDYTSAALITQNEFQHIAICRAAGVVRGFIDGIKVFEGSWAYDFTSTAAHTLGSKTDGTSGLVGSISEFRVTNGVCRYIENFIPPNREFPNF